MPWMVKWAGPVPAVRREPRRARISAASTATTTSTSASATPARWPATGRRRRVAAVERQMRRGITHMLPTEDAAWVGEELTRRFGVGSWQFALSASDANRWVLRLARHITGRSKVVVHDHCYHGSVDEAIAMLGPDGAVVPVRGSVGPQVDVARDDPGRRVQRRRRARGRARRRRGRGRPVRAGADERRDRPAGARLPRRRPRDHPPDRHAPGHRRDPHDLRGTRRRDRRLGSRARHASSSARRSAGGIPSAAYGFSPEVAARITRLDRGRGLRRRRDRRHAGGLRAVTGRDAGDARRGPDGRGVRADDPARGALGGGRQRGPARRRRARGT